MNIRNSLLKSHMGPKENRNSISQARIGNTISRRVFLKVTSLASLSLISSCSRPTSVVENSTQKRKGVAADCHLHMNSPATYRIPHRKIKRSEDSIRLYSAKKIISYLDSIEARTAFALSAAYLWGSRLYFPDSPEFEAGPEEYENVKAENDYTSKQAALYPDRIIPFCSVNPLKPYAIDEIERCVSTLKMQGLKLHFWNSDINLRRTKHVEHVRLVFAKAALLNTPVLVHLFNGGIEGYGTTDMQLFVRDILSVYPNLRLCFAHLTGAGSFPAIVADTFGMLIRARENYSQLKAENLYVDLAGVFNDKPFGSFEAVTKEQLVIMGRQLRKWGLDNILWGSDNLKDYLETTKSMWPLTNEEYNHIMSNNGRSFLCG